MEISFDNPKLERLLIDDKRAQKELGARRARIFRTRLADLQTAPTLADAKLIAGRLHAHSANNHGLFTVDLDQPFRLFFAPDHDPLPLLDSGGLDWQRVTRLRILYIDDPHGK